MLRDRLGEGVNRYSGRLVLSAGVLLLFATGACEPPGKPQPEEISSEITDFKILYNTNCAGCHGADGRYGPGRILNDRLYLALLPQQTLNQILTYGRPGTAMPAWAKSQGGPLSEKQVDALVGGIEKHWGDGSNFDKSDLPPYSAQVSGDANQGRKVFAKSCFMCHGKGAKVGAVTDPAYLSLVSDQVLRTSVIVGRPDLGMPDYRTLNVGKPLSDQAITDVVAYLISLRPQDINNATLNGSPSATEKTMATTDGRGDPGGTVNQTRGSRNEGSGNGPGSHRKDTSGSKSTGASSQQGIK